MANDGKRRLTNERIKELLGNDGKNQYLIGKEEITLLLREVQERRESEPPRPTVSAGEPAPGRKFRW